MFKILQEIKIEIESRLYCIDIYDEDCIPTYPLSYICSFSPVLSLSFYRLPGQRVREDGSG